MQHLHLAVARRPRANANGRYGQALSDQSGQFRGHHFQHHSKGSGLLECVRVLDELVRTGLVPALDFIPSQGMDRLGG